jgi:hypothetical protein
MEIWSQTERSGHSASRADYAGSMSTRPNRQEMRCDVIEFGAF